MNQHAVDDERSIFQAIERVRRHSRSNIGIEAREILINVERHLAAMLVSPPEGHPDFAYRSHRSVG